MGGGSRPERRPAAARFVGRERELEELLDALRDAQAGRGRLLLVTGDPGIGKTRLADELTAAARSRGIDALWGRCWEGGGAPSYWPWVQVLRSHLRTSAGRDALAVLGDASASLGQLLPEVGPRPPEGIDPEQARFALFDAVGMVFANTTVEETLLVVLDDLHAADVPSLLLLQFLARDLRERRMVVLGTYRDVEARLLGTGTLIADLAREGRHIYLRGLREPAVAQLVEDAARGAAGRAAVEAVFRATEGNPLFVDEVVRLLIAEGSLTSSAATPLRVPDGVREAISRRLDLLAPTTAAILRAASVVGKEFDADVLARIAEAAAGQTDAALVEAARLRVVHEVPLPPGRHAFSHALVRETLYDQLAPMERARLHAATATVLEEMHPDHVSEIAHHSFAGIRSGEAERALLFAERAAEAAAAALAYEDALVHYEHALQAHALSASADEATRCRLLLGLGEAQWRSGDTTAAKETFKTAASLARRQGTATELARAALGHAVGLGGFFLITRSDQTTIALLEEALAAVGPDDAALRVRLLSRLGVELYFTGRMDDRIDASGEAVAIARRLGDPIAQALALFSRNFATWGPDSIDDRLADTDEMLRLAKRVGDKEMAALAHHFRFTCFNELADGAGIAREITSCIEISEELRQPFYRWRALTLRTLQAVLAGRFDEAERLADEAYQIGRLRDDEIATITHDQAHMFAIRWAQGRLDEIAESTRDYHQRFPWVPRWRMAMLAGHAGDAEAARVELQRHADDSFRKVARDGLWLLMLSSLAECAHLSDDHESAAALYELLEPFGSRNAITIADMSYGAVELRLGLLAATLGRWSHAVQHFDEARRIHVALGAPAFEAMASFLEGRALFAAPERDLRLAGAGALDDAEAACRSLGMSGILDRVRAVKRPAPGAMPRATSARACRLFAEGDYWTLSDAEGIVRLRDTKGMRALARLLAHPGREFQALDLATAADAGRTLDPPRRMADLMTETDASAQQAPGSRYRFGEEPSAATALERARVNVTRTIREAIGKIAGHRPEIASHLDRAVRTGPHAVYAPDPPPRIEWHL